ncbi:hypothetical protein [Brachybacterium sp. UMB0905]|uniref:hypothetical protein n=1 Tax=Brachybacterium sp. UMB0905 TaxID=2069310 RepID=UPI00130452B1|nr:hypothetical protein [Brachybacterium sp. UMB0905]
MTDPSIDDLRRAGTEEAVRPIQARIDEMLTSLPWHGRLIYRAALPASRRARGEDPTR